jgi:long-chain acyl-CoA synthetase
MENDYREKGDTWPKILKYNSEKYGHEHRAMRQKHYGIWWPYTWRDYYRDVQHLALGLLALGFEPGDKVLIIGDNAPQWYQAQLATQANRGVSVGLFSDLLPPEIQTVAQTCDVKFAIVESQEQVDKLLEIRYQLPLLTKVIYWNYKGLAHYKERILMGLREVLNLGETYGNEHLGAFDENVAAGKGDDICAIIHTAGTSGAPKAAVHTFRSLRAGSENLLKLNSWSEHDNLVPYLPPVWINEQWFGIGCHLLSGCTLNFAETSETQQRDSRETGPSIVCYGARLWESQAAMVQARLLEADALKRFVFRRLMPVGHKAAELKYTGKTPGLGLRLRYKLADIFLFKAIKGSLGLSNARICYSTGAILSPDAFKFYHALSLPLKSLYGTTEGGALSGAADDDIHFETVGPSHEGTEVDISADGEIKYRHAGAFSGYYPMPQKTAGSAEDDWFPSGDHGCLRQDGHLVFVERISDLITLPGGKQLSPQLIESRLRFSPYIKDAWVMAGPQGAYVSAVVIIDGANVGRWAGQRRVAFSTYAELSQAPEVYALVMEDIQRVNQTLPAGCRVKKYVNFHKEFDPDEGELTRTLNLRRGILEERYRGLVGAIYNEDDPEAYRKPHNGREGGAEVNLRIQRVESVA